MDGLRSPDSLWRRLYCCYLVITGFLDEEHDYPLAGLLIGGIIGLAFIAVGLFAKPKTVEKAAEGLNL